MLSKANIKFIKSLQVKKYRKQEQCFLVEGAKSVQELLASDFDTLKLLATKKFLEEQTIRKEIEVLELAADELNGLGEFQTNNSALAIARIKPNQLFPINPAEFVLVLDDIRDPGNLGTIIRTAEWFGISKIIASPETADFYNPKVISSTMGSFTRVQIFYTDLSRYLLSFRGNVFGAYLNGTDIHQADFGKEGIIVIGSESHGIRADLEEFITHKVTIPKYGQGESLNAAIATAIICDNLRRVIH